VVGGILLSPLTPGPAVSDTHTFELFAEIGVILLMFSIGVEFSLRDLLRVRTVALLGGPLGILLTVALSSGVGWLLGWPDLQSIIIGIVVSVASTMVMARLLLDRGELTSRHGRVMVGITLVEDLAVVVLIVLMPALGSLEPGRLLAIALALLKAAAILVPFLYLASKVFAPLMTRVARTRNPELFLLVSLAIALGTAALTQAVGLSLALGAFLAGLIISESDYAHETLARLLPLRDTFVAFFFVTVGVLIDPRTIVANLPLLGAMVGLVVLGKLGIWTLVVRIFRYPWSTALLVAVGLTQIGEFSFVLVQAARAAGHVGADVYNATLAASLLTILVNALLVRAVPGWLARVRLGGKAALALAGPEPGALREHVVLCGFGRVGSAVGEALDTFGVPYVVVETDPDIVKGLRGRGIPSLYGSAAHEHLLDAAGARQAALAVVALPEIEQAFLVVGALRAMRPDLSVLARAHTAAGHERLVRAGATEVIQPELEGAVSLIRNALGQLAIQRDLVGSYLERFHDAMQMKAGSHPAARAALPEVREVVIGPGALADQSLRQARVREVFGVTVIAIVRPDGDTVVNPPAETILRSGDRVRVFGPLPQIQAFRIAAESTEAPAPG
jgi:CPA2 family monovalent cation:H+ antiporter-2